MSNHYHLILSTPDGNIDAAMLYFHREISRALTRLSGNQDYRFQARYKWKLIENALQFENAYRYVARNPCTAGVVDSPTAYPFSTVSGEFGRSRLWCPVHKCWLYDGVIPESMAKREEWLEAVGTG
ncbi:MAG TPA: hypothetical protein VM901_07095 [Bdellovibrionota bacterium]|jgi:hypothetical protein|nr:hypothetical protein [Bdellovibrionota bacterium]